MVKLVDMGNHGDLTNEQWARIEPLLPKVKTKRGRPAQDHRKLLNGMVWVLRTGAPRRAIPERYGKWTTIYSRFQRWRKAGIWNKIFAELQSALDVESNVDWEIRFIDSTTLTMLNYFSNAPLGFYTGTGTWYFDQGDRLPDYYFLQGKEHPFKMYDGAKIIVFGKQ